MTYVKVRLVDLGRPGMSGTAHIRLNAYNRKVVVSSAAGLTFSSFKNAPRALPIMRCLTDNRAEMATKRSSRQCGHALRHLDVLSTPAWMY
eukprot:scaffold40051_cov23-Prasinocladus_malaysianus.AAC.3